MIFEKSEESEYPTFNALAVFIIIVYNMIFLMEWCYLLLKSLNFKSEKMKVIVSVYGSLICKRKFPKLLLDDEITKNSNESANGTQIQSKKLKTRAAPKSENLKLDFMM